MFWRELIPVNKQRRTNKLQTVYEHYLPPQSKQWILEEGDLLKHEQHLYVIRSVSRDPIPGAKPYFELLPAHESEIKERPRQSLPNTTDSV